MNFGGNVLDGNNHTSETPEAISRAVACLPASQMFELMTQMKACIQNNPMEARTMLKKNPQLTYALLQAQIVMNIMDPKDFMTTITTTTSIPATVNTPINIPPPMVIKTEPGISAPPKVVNSIPQPVPAPMLPGLGVPSQIKPQAIAPQPVPAPVPVPAPMMVQPPAVVPTPQTNLYSDTDFRTFDPRAQRSLPIDQDMRNVPTRPTESKSFPSDPRQRPAEVSRNDPRLARAGVVPTRPPPAVPPPARQNQANPNSGVTSDQDKTALIMQVLQLSDEQISLLPPEQRASILLLKEQIARTTQQ